MRKSNSGIQGWLDRGSSGTSGFRFPGGESIGDMSNRVASFIHKLEGHARDDTILVVSHSGVLRMLICHVLGIELRHWRQIRLDRASLSVIETYSEAVILSFLNDVSHLQCKGG